MYYNSDKLKLSYLLIPKCGSTSIQRALQSSETNKTKHPKYPSFTVIREPLSRFFSAYHELIKRNIFKGTPQELLDKIQTDGFFDAHLRPQSYYMLPADYIYTIDNIPFKIPHLNKGTDHSYPLDLEQFEEIYKEDLELWCKREGGHSN